MIDRYDPFRPTMSLRQMMDRLLEDAFVMPQEGSMEAAGTGPAMDIYEEGDNLVVEARLPGMKPEDIDVQIEQGILTISGESKAEEERKDRNYLIRERRMGRFSRSVRLPNTVNFDACEANYENGILKLKFPKSEQARTRRIQIGGGGQQAIEGQARGGRSKPDGQTRESESAGAGR